MKILITDNKKKNRGFSDELVGHPQVLIKNDRLEYADFSDCKLLFEHDEFDTDIRDLKKNIIRIRFSGGGGLKNEISSYDEGYKLAASIQSPEQINSLLSIIEKEEFDRKDVEMILGIDPKLELLLKPFSLANPFTEDEQLKKAKEELLAYLNQQSLLSNH